MPDGRNGIPLPSRPFESPMTLAVRNSRATVPPDPSLVAAGADEAEADTPQRIASDSSVIDAERDPLYGDRVQHSTNLKSEGDRDQLGCESVLHGSYSRSVRASADADSEAAEALRVSRLRRYQAC